MLFKLKDPWEGVNQVIVLFNGAKSGLAIEEGLHDSENERTCSAIGHFALQSATLLR